MKPREKFIKKGVKNLEGWELIAIMLGSGIVGQDIFKLSKKVFSLIEDKKEKIKVSELESLKGIGKIKSMQIISAFELAKRYFLREDIIINSSFDIVSQLIEYRSKKQEYLICITLDGANRLINKRVITIGLLNQSLVHPREIFADAIIDRANSIVLAHNHPSGTNNPSNEDIFITNRINKVSQLIGIKLLDHIIITKKSYFSFKENNLL